MVKIQLRLTLAILYGDQTDNNYYEIRLETSYALVSNVVYILPNISDRILQFTCDIVAKNSIE